MKLPVNILACGLNSPEAKVLFAARYLFAGTQPSPTAVIVKPAVAKGAISPGNPTANPPVPPNPPVGIAAISSVVVAPLPAFQGSVTFEPLEGCTKIEAILPYAVAAMAVTDDTATIPTKFIGEVTRPNFDLGNYQGDLSGRTPTTSAYPAGYTIERMLYDNVPLLAAVDGKVNKIEKILYQPAPNAPKIAAIRIEAYSLPAQYGGVVSDM